MCAHGNKVDNSTLKTLVGLLSLATVGLLAACIALAVGGSSSSSKDKHAAPQADSAAAPYLESKASSSFFADDAVNACAGAKIALEDGLCADLEVVPQSGANVTRGYVGQVDMGEMVPTTDAYYKKGMCPVNVHWHLGTEHYSVGQYDENGDGPHGNIDRPEWADRALASAEGEERVRDGFRCHHYDETKEEFTKTYDWKHCVGMEVGETYEVHWPHSSAGACGTVDQYQTPFYDGVFCNLDMEGLSNMTEQQIARNVGVHGQVFTVVNDESYFYPDMIRGMIVDGELGKDIHYYTGSTTGTTRDNVMCSRYAPITWQVDRRCHLISASSFDKLCYDMKMQRDDMGDDLHAHGSRELVMGNYVADNQHYSEDDGAAGGGKNLRR